jgi:glycogen(starch) synthase
MPLPRDAIGGHNAVVAKRGKKSGEDSRIEATRSINARGEKVTPIAAVKVARVEPEATVEKVPTPAPVEKQERKQMTDGVAAVVIGNSTRKPETPASTSQASSAPVAQLAIPATQQATSPAAWTASAAAAAPPPVVSPAVAQRALVRDPSAVTAPTLPPIIAPSTLASERSSSASPVAPAAPQAAPPRPSSAVIEKKPSAVSPSKEGSSATDVDEPLLFEVAWEVCWQLGGIYTVLRSKAAEMIKRRGDRCCLIGPYNPATAAVEFEEMPSDGVIRRALDGLRATGVPCHFGRWLIAGRPRVILLDYRARFGSLDQDKYLLWADHGITTMAGDGEVNEVVAFGFVVTEFFRILTAIAPGRPLLAHFHEWMGGIAVPRIAHLRLPVTTIFTTHATLLGRYLASDNPYFYDHLPFVNSDAEAAKYNILPRHQIEKAAAHSSTVFTTVSEVTSIEAEKLLGRVPDMILPNGLNIQRFAALHEFQNLHARYKERIHEFVMGHFFPSYTFDLDKTLYFFTSGRYEYRNKGLDVFIEAMARLNGRLKQMTDPPTVVAFIVTRAPVRNVNVGVLQSQMQMEDLRSYCETMQESMGRSLFLAAAAGRMITMNELLPDDSIVRLKRAIHAGRRYAQPNIVTHDLVDDANDPVLRHLRHRQLFNAADDPVKMIFHPEFVTATSPLISLDYEQFVRGCHMGIFPSYYEPWGYTPMESVALGVPAVTTDLSGFGAYVERHVPHHEDQGITVLKRRDRSFDECTDDLVNRMMSFVHMNRRQRIELRNRTERHSDIFDWAKLARLYHEAHDVAISRTGGKAPGKLDVLMV